MSKVLTGTVVSTKMNKTIVVRVERKLRHPLYRKVIVMFKKFKAHYEGNDIKEGDYVAIRETSPISKDKHFIVIDSSHKKGEIEQHQAEAHHAEAQHDAEAQVAEVQAEIKAEKPMKKAVKNKPVKKVTKKVVKSNPPAGGKK